MEEEEEKVDDKPKKPDEPNHYVVNNPFRVI